MLDDIRPPKPKVPPVIEKPAIVNPVIPPVKQELENLEKQPIKSDGGLIKPPKKKLNKLAKIFIWVGVSLIAILAGLASGAWLWYSNETSPISDDKQILIPVTIEPGMTPGAIGKLLEEKSLIRSSMAFDIYTYFANNRNKLQAGSYRLSPAESTQDIVGHLVSGKVSQFTIRFLPGATLAENKKVLLSAGFSEEEIIEAFAAKYDSPLFASKPAISDLEGYIYGEDYSFNEGTKVSDILKKTFEEYYKDITENDLLAGFKSQGLNLYQAITLASIVQREASKAEDQKQVAQVFLQRLKIGMALGSDVTYQYIADKLGLARDTNLDNPYNTRRYAGLPPGPIATPGLSALMAVAYPASGDYLYFLAGDDGKIYFAHTNAEHESNKLNYCKIGCSTL